MQQFFSIFFILRIMYLSDDPRRYYLFNPGIYCIAKKPFYSFDIILYGSTVSNYYKINNSFNFDDSSAKNWYTKQCASLKPKIEGFPLISLFSFPKDNSYQTSLYHDDYQILFQYLNGSYSFDFRFDICNFLSLYVTDLIDKKSYQSYLRMLPILKVKKLFISTEFQMTDNPFDETIKSLAFQLPILNNKVTFAVENPRSIAKRYSISDKVGNHIINFYFEEFSKKTNFHLHYKYKFENGNKIGAFYDCNDDCLFIRGSTLNILDIFKIKISCKITNKFEFSLNSFRIDCKLK